MVVVVVVVVAVVVVVVVVVAAAAEAVVDAAGEGGVAGIQQDWGEQQQCKKGPSCHGMVIF